MAYQDPTQIIVNGGITTTDAYAKMRPPMTRAQQTAIYLTQTPGPHLTHTIERLWGRPITRCPPDISASISTHDLIARILQHDPPGLADTGQPRPDCAQAHAFNARTVVAVLPRPHDDPPPAWAARIVSGRTTVAELRRRGASRSALYDAINRAGWLCVTVAKS